MLQSITNFMGRKNQILLFNTIYQSELYTNIQQHIIFGHKTHKQCTSACFAARICGTPIFWQKTSQRLLFLPVVGGERTTDNVYDLFCSLCEPMCLLVLGSHSDWLFGAPTHTFRRSWGRLERYWEFLGGILNSEQEIVPVFSM